MSSEFVKRIHYKNWSVMVWSDGKTITYSRFVWNANVSHVFHLYDDLRYTSLPRYVVRAIYQLREDFRPSIRLPLEVRTAAWLWKRQGHLKVSYR